MTNSMIPYMFVPGTKAKASEVNANFIAIGDYVDDRLEQIIDDINSIVDSKADKTEIITEHTVNVADTDLNDYKTKGTYIFNSDFLPLHSPKNLEESVVHLELSSWQRPLDVGVLDGVLIVIGDENSRIKQIWICTGENPEIFTREFDPSVVTEVDENEDTIGGLTEPVNTGWSDWYSIVGQTHIDYTSYLKLPNGLILQWGILSAKNVTFPLAYRGFACPVVTKVGSNSAATKVDAGIVSEALTGFTFTPRSGTFEHMNWIAIGF